MKYNMTWLMATMLLLALNPMPAAANELSGNISVEGTGFFQKALPADQGNGNLSVTIEPEYYHAWSSGADFTVTPFLRLDSSDSSSTGFDIRELHILFPGNGWELRFGSSKVFWGVTEFVHLVDIINQTDLSHNTDGEEKLGQPMVLLSLPSKLGVLDLFVLPGFRQRRFPGHAGRLRSHMVVDTDQALYESSRGRKHIDIAARYSRSVGPLDLGLSYFRGTGREPSLHPGHDPEGRLVLVPRYEQIRQTSLDLLLMTGSWTWKLEAINRSSHQQTFTSAIAGFEYTYFGAMGSQMDLGLVGEWVYDDRHDSATTPFQNDILLGLRLAANDASGTELLAGILQDATSESRVLQLEASRRFGDRWRVSLESRAFLGVEADDFLYDLRRDGYLRLSARIYF